MFVVEDMNCLKDNVADYDNPKKGQTIVLPAAGDAGCLERPVEVKAVETEQRLQLQELERTLS